MTRTTKSSSRHALFVSSPGWGHLKPLATLAAKMVKERPDVIITYTVPGGEKARVEDELDKYFNNNEQALRDNIRPLDLGGEDETDILKIWQAYFQGFAKVYPAIFGAEQLHCATGCVYPAIPRPEVILLDPYLLDILQTIRKVSGTSVPVLAWNTAALTAMLRFYGPPSLGGLGNTFQKVEPLVKETGKSSEEIILQLYQPVTGELIELPRMPPMYDYEFNRQHPDALMLAFRFMIYPTTSQFFEDCDGVIALGNLSFEPEACAAWRTWFAPRPTYFVGPLIPDEVFLDEKLSNSRDKDSSTGTIVKMFLDTIRKTHGDHSLLYISFGSFIFPEGDAVQKVLEVILDMKIPLILSHDPKKAEISAQVKKRLQASTIVLILRWAPQDFILGHRATGWFLTHCGNNSMTEAVSHGTPMIAWPLTADQFANAAYTSHTLNITYELFETRRAVGLKPLHRGIHPKGTLEAIEKEVRSVLENAGGSDGRQKRDNIQVLKKMMNMAWTEDGVSRGEFCRFLDRFLPLS